MIRQTARHREKSLRHQIILPVVTCLALLFLAVAIGNELQYSEAPMLAERVAAGELPSVEERLPINPMVVEPHESIGQYGGTWHKTVRGTGRAGDLYRNLEYTNLVRWTPDVSTIIPNVAEDVEFDELATTFTFHLREGMKWSDGTAFTADDILFWYEDIALNEELSPGGPPAFLIDSEGQRGTIEKIDDYTFTISFSAPHGLFLQLLASPTGHVMTRAPQHYLSQFHINYNEETLDELVSDEGVADWVELFGMKHAGWGQTSDLPTLSGWIVTTPFGEGTRVVYERNPYFFKVDPEGNQLPYIDRVYWDVITDPEVAILRTLAGEIDTVLGKTTINSFDNKALFVDNAERGNYRVVDHVSVGQNSTVIMFNLNHEDEIKREIFQNRDFRVGLSHAIDRQEIIDVLYVGQAEPWQVAPRREAAFFNERLATQYTDYDVNLANEYLDRAGYTERDEEGYRLGPDGERISFAISLPDGLRTEWPDLFSLIEQYWRNVGIDAQISVQEESLYATRTQANQHDVAVWVGLGGIDVALRSEMYLPHMPDSSGSSWARLWARWYDSRGSAGEEPPEKVRQQMELYDQFLATADEERQAELMGDILDIAADQFYTIGISLPAAGVDYGIISNDFRNVPDLVFNSWGYVSPASTNTEQYFIEGATR